APAVRRAAGAHAARMIETRGQRAECETPGDRSWHEPLRGRAVAQPTAVGAPAVRRAASGHATGVGGTRAHRGKREAPGHWRRNELTNVRAVAQLARGIVAPAVCRATRGYAAGVLRKRGATRAQRGERQAPGDRCGDGLLGGRTV